MLDSYRVAVTSKDGSQTDWVVLHQVAGVVRLQDPQRIGHTRLVLVTTAGQFEYDSETHDVDAVLQELGLVQPNA